MNISRSVIVLGVIALAVEPLAAATVYFRDLDGGSTTNYGFQGNAVVDSQWDDTFLQAGGTNAGSTTNANTATGSTTTSLRPRKATSGVVNYPVIALKDMFSMLPKTNGSGGTLSVTNATLHLYTGGTYTGAIGLTFNRIKTDWLAAAAGANDTQASAFTRNGTNLSTATPVTGTQRWAGGGQFGAADLDATTAVSTSFVSPAFGTINSFNITPIISQIYDLEVNYGFAFTVTTAESSSTVYNFRSSNDGLNVVPVIEDPDGFDTRRPVLALTYEYIGGEAPIPEPATASLLALGAMGFLARRSRKH